MKYLIIPDLHGKSDWVRAINSIEHDQVVFLGDYFDNLSTEKEIANFFEILNHKKEHSKTTHLLIGNHELHYLSGIDQKYSGFKSETFELKSPVLEELISRGWLKVAHAIDEHTICSHAGISSIWAMNNGIPLNLNAFELAETVNQLFQKNRGAFKLARSHHHGLSVESSPLWIRPDALEESCYANLFQIVGHTQVESLSINGNICFTDCLNFNDSLFLTISEGGSVNLLGK